MKKLFLLLGSFLLTHLASAAAVATLNGSGATFPAPLYQRWAAEFHEANPSMQINYQGVGSGAGVSNFSKGITDFCGSDVALTDKEIDRLQGNILMIPVTAGMIVLSYNIPGLSSLRLSRAAYIGIVLGTITEWDHPLIAAANPGVTLPKIPITFIARADGSGTTALFSEHLAAINPDFDRKVGAGKSVKWPVGLAGKGNDGVTSLIKATPGSIGYIEYGFAKNNNLLSADLENKTGAFVAASDSTGLAALSSITLPDNLRNFDFDPNGPMAYPITGFTWLITKKAYPAEKAAMLKAFLTYGLTKGQSLASSLGYLPLPQSVLEKATQAVTSIK